MDLNIFSYETKNLSKVERVKFLYALRGRNKTEGIINFYKAEEIGKNSIMVKETNKEEIKSFFKTWKVPITIYTITLKEKEHVTNV